jgi:ribosomal protein S27AE
LEEYVSIGVNKHLDGATLHPNLTYKIKYLEGGVDGREKECEAMAYSVVKDGKLLGSGVVFSEALATTAREKIWALGDNAIINWKGVIFGLIVVLLVVWFGSRLVFGYASTLSQKRPQNECPRCGNQRFTVNAGDFLRCINCNNVWKIK